MTTYDMLWALAPELAEGVFSAYRDAAFRSRDEQVKLAEPLDIAEEARSISRMVDGVAVISVNGPIDRTTQRGWWTGKVFATGQNTVRFALAQALENPEARAVLLSVNSPGGVVSGAKELADYIAEAGKVKPLGAYVDGLAASAAYWLAASTGRVLSPATGQVGSIGVIMQVADFSGFYQKMGVSFEFISSGKYKSVGRGERPLTDEERAYFQERLAALHALFRDDVSSRMRISAAPAQWAEAQLLIAPRATELGLVSAIVRDEEAAIQTMMEVSMSRLTRETLAQDAPELVEALRKEGREEAEAQIREQLAMAGQGGSDFALAAMRAVCRSEDVRTVETLLEKARALNLTGEQLAGMAALFSQAPMSGAEQPGKESRNAVLSALRDAHAAPVNADRGVPHKNPLVADAERRAAAQA
ncbi:S49 family peptidase [uncultured Desulfovibrio sp.]|uniref:S49 family peptidase n=2 Tax=uncultured Desulfovibrio sp. TaxID=167968 RepID=UPI00262134DA|nr:S49 family peptidase [uncultured Desulfovibrio sp.]